MSTSRKILTVFLVILIIIFVPLHAAEAGGGGGFGSWLTFAISIVASVVLAFVGVPPVLLFLDTVEQVGIGAAIDGVITTVTTNILAGTIADVSIGTLAEDVVGGLVFNVVENQAICGLGGNGCGGSSSNSSPSSTAYNLYVTAETSSILTAGGEAKLSGTITNSGNGPITGSFNNRFEVFDNQVVTQDSTDLSPSPIYVSVADGLAAGASTDISTLWQVPSDFLGAYFLRLCANVGDNPSDSNLGNNCGDLQPFTVIASSTATTTGINLPSHSSLISEVVGLLAGIAKSFATKAYGDSGGDLTSGTPTIVPAPTGGTEINVCPPGRYFDQPTGQCIDSGYISCASVGYPDNFCAVGNVCTSDGECQSTSGKGGNSNVSGLFGEVCSSAANSCGMVSQGLYNAAGSCPALTPSESQCAEPVITASTSPAFINPGSSCTINWSISNATYCTLSGSDSQLPESASIPTGSYTSPPISNQQTYTLTCHNGTQVTASADVSCRINPGYREQ